MNNEKSTHSGLSGFSVLLLIVCFCMVAAAAAAQAQAPVIEIDFDRDRDRLPRIFTELQMSRTKEASYSRQFAPGLSGAALDLSKDAPLRAPVPLATKGVVSFGETDSFALQVWVRTHPGARQGTSIAGNKKLGALKEKGWLIYTTESGAWAASISDGKTHYTYAPTAARQAINDGRWHQIAISVNRRSRELSFFFDGKNVAIYHAPKLQSLETDLSTMVGGSDEYFEYDTAGQWTAFNGFIDEVKVWNSPIDAARVRGLYAQYVEIEEAQPLTGPLRTMVWNIFHGGRRSGQTVGVERVIDSIKAANVDVVGIVETYGSGEQIADALGYHFYLISSNLSIMSRFPIVETIQVFKPFNFGGAVIDLGNGRNVVFLNTWLKHLPDYRRNIHMRRMSADELIKDEAATRQAEITAILAGIEPWLRNASRIPVIMAGDFNGGSHLDWTERTAAIHNGYVVEWPVSKAMADAGFVDSFRLLHPDPLTDIGFTRPRVATGPAPTPETDGKFAYHSFRDRIDYIYFLGPRLKLIESKIMDYHPIMFPSDHAAMLSSFLFVP